MSGLNFSPGILAFSIVAALGSMFAPNVASAATKTTDRYHVNVPSSFDYNTTGIVRAQPSTISGPNQLAFSGVTGGNYVTGSNQTIQLGQFVVNPVTTASGADAVTTYRGTPFVIQIRAPEYDKTSSVPILSKVLPDFGKAFHLKTATLNSLLIRGHLDGTVNAAGVSNVTATVDSTRLGSVGTALPKNTAVNYTFPVHYGDLKLPTSWSMNTTGNALASTAVTTGSTTTTTTATPSIGSTATNSTALQILASPAAEMLTASSTPSVNDPTPTPEPATILIFAAAIGGFAWSRRRAA